MAEKETKGSTMKISNIQKAAADIRDAILNKESKMSWPPPPSELNDSAFLHTLLTGSKYSLEIIFSKSPAVDEVVRARPGIWSNQRED